ITVTLAVLTGEAWQTPLAGERSAIPTLAIVTTAAVFCQLVLGALMRHMGAGLAIPDFPLAFGRVIPPLVTPYITVHFAHRVGALVVVTLIAASATTVFRRHADEPRLRRPALLAIGLVCLQVTLGALVIWTRRAVFPTTLHLAIGAAVLATNLVLALRASRLPAHPRPASAPSRLPQEVLA
ncbi:MAG TPA: COX15/CtaA family protein, partial [Dongiaceae bacterium]|nr:COX15/CtaA family protein [Dongiaceae bacterium]